VKQSSTIANQPALRADQVRKGWSAKARLAENQSDDRAGVDFIGWRYSMTERRVTQIPMPGSSGETPTGAMQFRDDWPSLFVRGDDAIMLLGAIEQLTERVAHHPDVIIASALARLARIAEIIKRDVIVQNEPRAGG
jgi:hypothetical protein